MFTFLTETFHRLIEAQQWPQKRYLYPFFQLNNRLTGLVGSRGVGKTTLLLQHIKDKLFRTREAFYFSADLIYFQQTTLLECVGHLHTVEGYRTIFIDEIHKYHGWDQELKNLYDAFPHLKIVFSGSSMLDLVTGGYDLSRRAKLYTLQGLSFREYLNFSLSLDLPPLSLAQILEEPIEAVHLLKEVDRMLPRFEEYLQHGYYPFYFEDPPSYYEKILRVLEKSIFEDIANYYQLKTNNLHYLKQLLSYFASIPPGELNVNNLAKHLGVDHKTVGHYIAILESVGLVRQMRPYEGGSVGLRKAPKLLVSNTNLLHALHSYLGERPSKGMERELFFVEAMQSAGVELFYSKVGDYRTRDAVFEVGGKNKRRAQLKGAEEAAYVVKDGIIHPLKGEVPLFLFGFLY